jgi:hypothetical protein
MFVDKRGSPDVRANGNKVVMCCEGNAAYYELGMMEVPLSSKCGRAGLLIDVPRGYVVGHGKVSVPECRVKTIQIPETEDKVVLYTSACSVRQPVNVFLLTFHRFFGLHRSCFTVGMLMASIVHLDFAFNCVVFQMVILQLVGTTLALETPL